MNNTVVKVVDYNTLVKGAGTRVRNGSLAMYHGTLALALARAEGKHGIGGKVRSKASMDLDIENLRETMGLKSTWYKETRLMVIALVDKVFPDSETWRNLLSEGTLDAAIDALALRINQKFGADVRNNYNLGVHALNRKPKGGKGGNGQNSDNATNDNATNVANGQNSDNVATAPTSADDFATIVQALKRLADAGDIETLGRVADVAAAAVERTAERLNQPRLAA